jgi:transposase
VAVELPPEDVGDISELPDLIDQIGADVASMTADRAYDGHAVYDAVAERLPNAAVIVPPRITAAAPGTTDTQRDKHLTAIAEHGRMSWQRISGYNRRSLVETTMFCYKTVIGRRLHARSLSNQRAEAKVGCSVLNRMTDLGMPVSARIP